MGNFFCGNGLGLSLGLQERAKEFLRNEKNQKEIIDYFNSFDNWSKPNDKNQNSDKAIVKIYHSNENGYNLNIHIYLKLLAKIYFYSNYFLINTII